MRRSGFRKWLVVAGLAASSLAPVGVAQAATPPSSGLSCARTNLRCIAHQVVFRGDPMLEYLNWAKKDLPGKFNYSNDGCSVPAYVSFAGLTGAAVTYYKGVFKNACIIHDFGYRNFGSGTQAGYKQYSLNKDYLTANQRGWGLSGAKANIDRRFLSQMQMICSSRIDEIVCDRAASVFYTAVKNFGKIDG